MATATTGSLVLGFPTSTFIAVAGVFESSRYKCPEAKQNPNGTNATQLDANIHGVASNLPAPAVTLSPNQSEVAVGTTVGFTCFYTVAVTASGATTAEPSDGFSVGAAAGIGVGVAAAIIALATAAVWGFLLRRRYRSPTESTPLYRFPAALGTPDRGRKPSPIGPPPPTIQLPPRAVNSSPLELYYLRGPYDSDLVLELTAVGSLISHHARTFYHKGPLAPDSLPRIISSLSGLGLDTETCGKIANLALDKDTRYVAIQALLARVILSELDIRSGSSSLSLLPPSVAAFIKAIPLDLTGKLKLDGKRRAGSGVSRRTCPTPLTHSVTDLAVLMTWRRSAAFLLNKMRNARLPLEPLADMDAQIKGLQAALNGFLSIFVPEDSEARVKQSESLVRVIQASSNFGYLLFSSPCEWRLLFKTAAGSPAVVVVPGLERLSTYDDRMLEPGYVLVEPATRVNAWS